MSAGFTKGPWSADPMVPEAKRGFYIVATPDGNNSACDVATVGPTLSRKAEANAHLIAAAPELYEALTLWLAYDDQDEADFAQAGPMLLYARAIDATRAALARVRGQS